MSISPSLSLYIYIYICIHMYIIVYIHAGLPTRPLPPSVGRCGPWSGSAAWGPGGRQRGQQYYIRDLACLAPPDAARPGTARHGVPWRRVVWHGATWRDEADRDSNEHIDEARRQLTLAKGGVFVPQPPACPRRWPATPRAARVPSVRWCKAVTSCKPPRSSDRLQTDREAFRGKHMSFVRSRLSAGVFFHVLFRVDVVAPARA